jgi:hypothetical protein
MAFTSGGVLSIRGNLVNMTGQTNYTSGGTNIGKVVDVLDFQMGRDIKFYSGMETGDTPALARIVGEACRLTVRLTDYNAEWINLVSQRRPKSGYTMNYHFGAGASYVQGNLLSSSELIPIMIRDGQTPGDWPALYLPSTVTELVKVVRVQHGARLVDEAEVVLLALHNSTFGSIGAFGNLAGFPAL